MCKLFVEKREKDSFEEWCGRSFKKESPCTFLEVNNGIVIPCLPSNDKLSNKGGVIDEQFNYIELSGIYRGEINQKALYGSYDFNKEDIEYSDKTAIYLGIYINHWGHFILESLNRLWYLLNETQDKNVEYVFLTLEGFNNNCNELLELFGLPIEKIKFIEKPTQYKKVIVPEASYQLNTYWSDEYKNICNKTSNSIHPIKNNKIYLTRRKFRLGNLFGEEMLEKLFTKNGYKKIIPERLSASKQIGIISGTKLVAGITGSAMHSLVFGRDSISAIYLNRFSFINKDQCIINEMKNIDYTFIDAFATFMPALHGLGPFLMSINKYVEEFCSQENFKIIKQPKKFLQKTFLKYIKRWAETYSNEAYYNFLMWQYKEDFNIEPIKETINLINEFIEEPPQTKNIFKWMKK